MDQQQVQAIFYDKEYYDGTGTKSAYQGYKETNLSGVLFPLAELLHRFFRPRRALDCGCAKGFLVGYLRRLGVGAYGIDISSYAVRHGFREARDHLCQASITDLPFPDDHFDLVFATDTMEHLTVAQAEKAIDELARTTSRYLFLIICLNQDPSCPDDHVTVDPNDRSHITIATRGFWHKKFLDRGLIHRPGLQAFLVGTPLVQGMPTWTSTIFVYQKAQRESDNRYSIQTFGESIQHSLAQATALYNKIYVSVSVERRGPPGVSTLLATLKRAFHRLSAYYTNMLASRQTKFNYYVVDLLSQMVADHCRQDIEIARLRDEVMSLHERIAGLEMELKRR